MTLVDAYQRHERLRYKIPKPAGHLLAWVRIALIRSKGLDMNFADVLHSLVDYASDAFGAAKDEAHALVTQMYGGSSTADAATGRATVMVDGVERYSDTGDVVPTPSAGEGVSGDATHGESSADPSSPTSTGDTPAGDGGEVPASAEPASPATSPDPATPEASGTEVRDGDGNLLGIFDPATGAFAPVT